jgi:uncharacterized membrane protein YedE/YeeE
LIVISNFTPLASAVGGGLLGLAAALYMGLFGRIAGVSGMITRLLPPTAASAGPLAFLAGLAAAPVLYNLLSPEPFVQTIQAGQGRLAIAGFLVGIGTVYGNGCTSGHGICGWARLSRRSIVATCIFSGMAMLVTLVERHVIGG